jgi:hypothetical protein
MRNGWGLVQRWMVMGMREKLIELLEDVLSADTWGEIADHLIANGVTIPVRCKDCKWWEDWYCTNANGANTSVVNGDWFCCAGERRTDG